MAMTKAQVLALEILANSILTVGVKLLDIIGKTEAEKSAALKRALAGAKLRDPHDLKDV